MSLSAQTIEQFHGELASTQPSPGGGAVAAVTGATAAALATMVVNYSFTKKLEPHHDALRDAAARLDRARALFMTLADEDASAYRALAAAIKLPKDDPARAQTLPGAALAASQVPLAVMAASTDVLRLMESLPARTNRNLRSDLAIAADLAATACRAAMANVRINLPLLAEHAQEVGIADEADVLLETAQRLAGAIAGNCR